MMASITRDITSRKRMENELLKVEKLESLGILAGGIAHDFNNILSAILGNISLAKLLVQPEEKQYKHINNAEIACARARDLTQQLLTFSRGGAPVKNLIHINALIKESVTFALRGSKVKPIFTIAEDLWAVEVDAGQLNQVINNLTINANQAMPDGGTININARNVTNESQHLASLPDGKYIEIMIKDYGIGIAEENKARMFEPYFTTKGKGSGLGLATSYSIIKNHGGIITFESEVGIGTTFHVYLPASDEVFEPKDNHENDATTIPAFHHRILVMDDETIIRTILGRMLKSAKYDVELTADGSEAVQKYLKAKKSGKPFDAVILDLTVPGGMGGKDVIVKLREIDPGVKAIVSSGYADDPIMADYQKYGFRGVVAKPYRLEQMKKTLRDILTEY